MVSAIKALDDNIAKIGEVAAFRAVAEAGAAAAAAPSPYSIVPEGGPDEFTKYYNSTGGNPTKVAGTSAFTVVAPLRPTSTTQERFYAPYRTS